MDSNSNFSTEEMIHNPISSQTSTTETNNSFPSSKSQQDKLYKNSLRFFREESLRTPKIPLFKGSMPPLQQRRVLDNVDGFYPETDPIKDRINALMNESYGGNLKLAVEGFEKVKQEFIKALPGLGKDKAELCLRVGAIYYRGYTEENSLYWLKEALGYSKDMKEEDHPVHFRKIYLYLADVLIKRGEYEDAEMYLMKAEDLFGKYFENDETKEGRRSRSWAFSLRGHILSKNKEYEKAEELYIKSMKLKETLPDMCGLEALGIDYLVDCYVTWGKIDKAKPLLEKAFVISEKVKGYYTEARLWRNQGRICFIEKDEETWKECYREAFVVLARELPSGNSLEVQYRKEYKEKFGVDYEEEDDLDVAEESLQTNSI